MHIANVVKNRNESASIHYTKRKINSYRKKSVVCNSVVDCGEKLLFNSLLRFVNKEDTIREARL